VAILIAAQTAAASFHLMFVREVYPGGSDNGSYIELQMWTSGQNFVEGHHLISYNASGGVQENYQFPTPANIFNGATQSTILVADSEYATVFPGKPGPDKTDANFNLDPAGGAVCWAEASPPDCVSWGAFTGNAMLPAPGAGNPASPSGVSAGKALWRSIASGCATMLESGDDHDDSATDFSEQTPLPRNNSTTPTETECAGLPNTVIDTASVPAAPTRTKSTSATFTYHVVPAGSATFECNLDEAGFVACPANYSGLAEGEHEFEVRAVTAGGTDPSPAVFHWIIDLTGPTVILDTPKPSDPNSGINVTFKYHSSETLSTFECSIAKGAEPDTFSSCSATKTYPKLLTGSYTFKVRAKDQAGNLGEPTSFSFAVDNTLGDTDPPETTIKNRPPDPSSSSTAEFTYESNEPGSTFECKLDGGAFTPCGASGIIYDGLGEGQHTFQVLAIDLSENVGPAAGYSFSVVLPTGPVLPPPPEETKKPSPDTKMTLRPKAKTKDRTPTFKFKSTVPGASYECKLDGKTLKPCRSPLTTKPLSFGKHTLKVTAVLPGGIKDTSPAVYSFKVVRP
jgi:hypothetical protein